MSVEYVCLSDLITRRPNTDPGRTGELARRWLAEVTAERPGWNASPSPPPASPVPESITARKPQ
ncbi:hypothetical protein [Actinomadura nitritigenes]|uniref:hypothetical protein n=1 Tax=Actinomadura nitritigenes TaxID=134602 RepID=UPI003D89DBBD